MIFVDAGAIVAESDAGFWILDAGSAGVVGTAVLNEMLGWLD
ncbi:MAG: hypothetical protein QF473_00210 [Planctomycetota bacterium]|jgi:hypothetical protein|nr:hypothetical protein [Planctomycetota bacterium]